MHPWLPKNDPSEDSDQTARMRRLMRIFAGRTRAKVRFLTLRFMCVFGRSGSCTEGTFSDVAAHVLKVRFLTLRLMSLCRRTLSRVYIAIAYRGGSRMISEGLRFDQIIVLTLRIRKDRPEQTL